MGVEYISRFMAASKILGEDSASKARGGNNPNVTPTSTAAAAAAAGANANVVEEEGEEGRGIKAKE